MVRRSDSDSDSDPGSRLMPVAAYLRASTDLQQYSLANQDEAIQTYARQHRMAIVRIYQDEGQSGLTVDRRTGLQALLRAIENGDVEFEGVLVLDVSRWGRFQNLDEAAYYEFRCWKARIRVSYQSAPADAWRSLARLVQWFG